MIKKYCSIVFFISRTNSYLYENARRTISVYGDVSFYFRTFVFRSNSYIACRNK